MEEKYNQATHQRPEGTRPLDAAIIPINIPKYIDAIKQEEAYHKNGKNAITIFKSDQVTITLIALKENQSFHPGQNEDTVIMSIQLLNGSLSFESLGTMSTLKEGELMVMHQQLSFNAAAISDCICLLTLFK